MLFFSREPQLPLLFIFATSIPDPRTPRWEFDSKWYFVLLESAKVFVSHPNLSPKPRPGSMIQFVKVKNYFKKSHFWKSSKKLFIFPEESRFDSIMIPHKPRPVRVRIAGDFLRATSCFQIYVKKSCFLGPYFSLFWPSWHFKTSIGGTVAVGPLWFGRCNAWALFFLPHKLEPRTSLRCWNIKVQKWVKSGHFWPLYQISSSRLKRSKGVERFWFVHLVHTLPPWSDSNRIPFGSESSEWHSVEIKKSRKSTFAKKWKKSIFATYIFWSISATAKGVGPQFKPPTLEWGSPLPYRNPAKIRSRSGEPGS